MILSGLYSMTCTAKALEVNHIESPLRCHANRFNMINILRCNRCYDRLGMDIQTQKS